MSIRDNFVFPVIVGLIVTVIGGILLQKYNNNVDDSNTTLPDTSTETGNIELQITGMVLNQENRPVKNASISFTGLAGVNGYTDDLGSFVIDANLDEKDINLEVVVSGEGYETRNINKQIGGRSRQVRLGKILLKKKVDNRKKRERISKPSSNRLRENNEQIIVDPIPVQIKPKDRVVIYNRVSKQRDSQFEHYFKEILQELNLNNATLKGERTVNISPNNTTGGKRATVDIRVTLDDKYVSFSPIYGKGDFEGEAVSHALDNNRNIIINKIRALQ